MTVNISPGAERLSMPTPTPTVAALYVQTRGVYYGVDGVDAWGLPDRDAREYAGPWPVVAHPPCERHKAAENKASEEKVRER